MKKIYDQIELSFRKLKNHFIDTIVSDFLDIRSPSMGVPTVRAVQVDNTLNPGTSIEYGRAYILTDVSELHANFIVPADVADNDIVMWTGRFFKIVMRAADATAKGLVVKTYVTSTDEDYTFSDSAWTSGTSSFDPAANTVVTGAWSFDISGGKSFIVSDDPTLVAPSLLFGLFDGSLSPDTIYSYNSYSNVDDEVGNYWVYDKISLASTYLSCCKNALGEAVETLSVSTSGVSLKSITADKIQLTGVQQHSGYKSGTLASPPAAMVIGEVWADTTDSATHPIYRISTVTT